MAATESIASADDRRSVAAGADYYLRPSNVTITRDDFFKGRDVTYAADMTQDIEIRASATIVKVNLLLAHFGESRAVNSGWRPPSINAATPGAARFSKHMLGQACDLDDPEGDLDQWCMDHPEILERIGLWLEHPASTKSWNHTQSVPYKSWVPGKPRWFYP